MRIAGFVVEEQGLNETVNNVNISQEAIRLINCYEDMIKALNKKAIEDNGKEGEVLKKFEDTENFFDNVAQSRSMIQQSSYKKYFQGYQACS